MNVAFNRDCLEAMREMDDNAFELAIVDVPYGIGEDVYVSGAKPCLKWRNPTKREYKTVWDVRPSSEYFHELRRVSQNQIVWGANHFISEIPFDSPCWIVWDKRDPLTDQADCELAWTSFRTAVRKFDWLWSGFKKQQPEQRFHPTQKPVALYKWLLQNYAKPGDKILDTHLGSGSSRIACYDLGFDFTGYELDADYFQAQEERFARHTAQQTLFTPEAKPMIQEAMFA